MTEKKRIEGQVAQGDTLLTPVAKMPAKGKRMDKPFALAYGEVTGHAHVVVPDLEADPTSWIELLETEANETYFKVHGKAKYIHGDWNEKEKTVQDLSHPDHFTIALQDGGVYQADRVQCVWHSGDIARVAD